MGEWLVMVVPKSPRLPVKVIETLIIWCVELSVVAVGSVVLPTVFDKGSVAIVVLGVVASIFFVVIASILAWRAK